MASSCSIVLAPAVRSPGSDPQQSSLSSNSSPDDSPTNFVPTRRKKTQPIHRRISPFQNNADDNEIILLGDINANETPKRPVSDRQKHTIKIAAADIHKKPKTPKKLADISIFKSAADTTNNNDIYSNNNISSVSQRMQKISIRQQYVSAAMDSDDRTALADDDDNNDNEGIAGAESSIAKISPSKKSRSKKSKKKQGVIKSPSRATPQSSNSKKKIKAAITQPTVLTRSRRSGSSTSVDSTKNQPYTHPSTLTFTPDKMSSVKQVKIPRGFSSQPSASPVDTPGIVEQENSPIALVKTPKQSPVKTAHQGNLIQQTPEKQNRVDLSGSIEPAGNLSENNAILPKQSSKMYTKLSHSLGASNMNMTSEELAILNMFDEVDVKAFVTTTTAPSVLASAEQMSPKKKVSTAGALEKEPTTLSKSESSLSQKIPANQYKPKCRGKGSKHVHVLGQHTSSDNLADVLDQKHSSDLLDKASIQQTLQTIEEPQDNGAPTDQSTSVVVATKQNRKFKKQDGVVENMKNLVTKPSKTKKKRTKKIEAALNATLEVESAAMKGETVIPTKRTDDILFPRHDAEKSGKKKRRKVSALEPAQKMKISRIVPLFPRKSSKEKSIVKGKQVKSEMYKVESILPKEEEIEDEDSDVSGSSKQFKCKHCSYSSSSRSHVKVHMRIHTGEKPHKCGTCMKGFVQASALKVHLRIHTNERPYSCKVCDGRFRTHGHLADHIRIHTGERPYMCVQCHKTFRISTHLQSHLKIHSNERAYKCLDCGKAFIQSSQLKIHQKIHNREAESKHVCTVCSKRFMLPGNLQVHMRTVHNQGHKPYVCPESSCGKTFTIQAYLTRHKKAIHSEISKRRVSCPVCNKELSKMSMQHHLLTHATDKKYICNICSRGFHYSHGLLIHMRVHSKDLSFHCPICHVMYPDMSTMRRHIKKMHRIDPWEKKFRCEVCHNCFFSNGMLSRHQKEVHTQYRPYRCDQCNRDFKNERNLKQHMRGHDKNTFTKCPLCDKMFSQKGNLGIHFSTVHHKIKDFACHICPVKFATKRNLEQHIRTHTGDKPFKCQYCPKQFTQGGSLARHEMTHSGQKPFMCHLCPKGFVQKVHLNGHLKTHCDVSCMFCDQVLHSRVEARHHIQQLHLQGDTYRCCVCDMGFTKKQEFVTHSREICKVDTSRTNEIIYYTPRRVRTKKPKVPLSVPSELGTTVKDTAISPKRRSNRKRKSVENTSCVEKPGDISASNNAGGIKKRRKKSKAVENQVSAVQPCTQMETPEDQTKSICDDAPYLPRVMNLPRPTIPATSGMLQTDTGLILGTISPMKSGEICENKSDNDQETVTVLSNEIVVGVNALGCHPAVEPLNLTMDQNSNSLKADSTGCQPIHTLHDIGQIKKELVFHGL